MIYQPNDRKIRKIHIDMKIVIWRLETYTPKTWLAFQIEVFKMAVDSRNISMLRRINKQRKDGQP